MNLFKQIAKDRAIEAAEAKLESLESTRYNKERSDSRFYSNGGAADYDRQICAVSSDLDLMRVL